MASFMGFANRSMLAIVVIAASLAICSCDRSASTKAEAASEVLGDAPAHPLDAAAFCDGRGTIFDVVNLAVFKPVVFEQRVVGKYVQFHWPYVSAGIYRDNEGVYLGMSHGLGGSDDYRLYC